MPLLQLSLSLFAAHLGTGVAQTIPTNRGYYMQPSIRGNDIVFISQGDLWRVGLDGGAAHALTGHVAPASHPAISPDGKTVAFSGTYEGPREVYTMSLDGDLPRRLTFEGGMTVQGWSPTGGVLAKTELRSTLPDDQLVTIDPKTRVVQSIPLTQANDGTYDSTGNTLFFTRLSFQGSNTKRYQGGTAQGIWKYTKGTPEAINLTKSFPGTSREPLWWNGRIYFLSDRDGTVNLWSMDENGGSLKQLTHSDGWDIQEASLDHGIVVYQLGADLHRFDIVRGEDKTLDITLTSDFESTRDRWLKDPMGYVSDVDLAFDGSKVALTTRGQVFAAPVEPGRFVEITRKPGVRYRGAIFSPDGKWIYALSDQSGETEWWRMPANGVGHPEQLTFSAKVLNFGGKISPDGKRIAYYNKDQELWVVDVAAKSTLKVASSLDDVISDFAWSPDSKWLAIAMPSATFSRINLFSVISGKLDPVTTERSDARSPAWSRDGKWLYFLSDRTFDSMIASPWGPRQPEPFFDRQSKVYAIGLVPGLRSPFQPADELFVQVPPKEGSTTAGSVETKVELKGIQERLWEIPVAPGNYQSLSVSADRLFILDSSNRGPSNLLSIEIKDKDVLAKPLVQNVSSYHISGDGKQLLVWKDNQLTVGSAAGTPDKAVDLSGWNFSIQPREEWHQMFAEAWRLERDYFYDRQMLSVDWPSIRKKYEVLVDRVRDRSELSNVLAQMVGELSTLHMFVYGGDNRQSPDSIALASLGGEFVRDEVKGGYRITRIYRGDPDYPNSLSPLLRPGVGLMVGDTIVTINGQDCLSASALGEALRNQTGRQVLIHVRDASGKERDCIVRPISSSASSDLRYSDWEISRREKVETDSKGSIGYLHLRAMGKGDIATWARDFYPLFNRSGLIIDVRHNGGGNIDSWILEKLIRKAWFYWQPRIGNPYWNMQYAFRGHVAVLCDEFTGSDGEAFTEGIKRLGIGKVIGTRTWGGEVWLSSSNFLGDGGIATAAEFGVYGPEGKWIVEGHGVEPDVTVDNLPHSTFLGNDAQLEAAMAYLAKEIKEKPVPIPPAPRYPNKAFPPLRKGH